MCDSVAAKIFFETREEKSAGSKPAPFAENQNAKSAAPPRVEVVTELDAGAARNGRPPVNQLYFVCDLKGWEAPGAPELPKSLP